MHFGIILTRFAEHIDDSSMRVHVAPRPVLDHRSHLHTRTHLQLLSAVSVLRSLEYAMDRIYICLRQRLEESGFILLLGNGLYPYLVSAEAGFVALCERNGYVVRHETALHEHPCLSCDDMENADERLWRSCQNGNDLSLPALTVGLFPGNSDTHCIAVKGSAGLRRLDKDIIFLTANNHKQITLSGHLDPTFHQWEHLLFLFSATPTAGVFASCHIESDKSLQN